MARQLQERRAGRPTLQSNVEYGTALARTTYGVIGVKVWIYKGDIERGEKINHRVTSAAGTATAVARRLRRGGGRRCGGRGRGGPGGGGGAAPSASRLREPGRCVMAYMPKRIKRRRVFRGKIKGLATRGNRSLETGLQSLTPGGSPGASLRPCIANRATQGAAKIWIRALRQADSPSPPRPGWAVTSTGPRSSSAPSSSARQRHRGQSQARLQAHCSQDARQGADGEARADDLIAGELAAKIEDIRAKTDANSPT